MSESLDPEAMEAVDADQIRIHVRGFIAETFLPQDEADTLTDSTPLITGGVLDSIGSVKLVSHLEERYGIRLESHEVSIEHLDTVNRVVSTVVDKLDR